jgi:hypothetical protein
MNGTAIGAEERNKNLLVVAAAEQYALAHGIKTPEAFGIFLKNGVNTLIRKHYNVLHTQSLEESFYFACDILKRKLG